MKRTGSTTVMVAALIAFAGVALASDHEAMKTGIRKIYPEHQTVFVVIAPVPQDEQQPRPRELKCIISPDPREIPRGLRHMTVLNLTDQAMKVEVSNEIADTDEVSLKKTLMKDEYLPVLLRDLPEGEYIFSIEGPDGGCLPSDLPNPKIKIP